MISSQPIVDVLRRYAEVMRPLMLRAGGDPAISWIGKRSYSRTGKAVMDTSLACEKAIRHPDPRHATDAAIARCPGFGSSLDAAGEGDWRQRKNDLGDMLAA